MRRLAVAGTTMLVLGAICAGGVFAQAPPPTVTVTFAGDTVTVAGAEAIAGGAARFEFVNAGDEPASASMVALRSGITPERVRDELTRLRSPYDLDPILDFVAGSTVEPGDTYASTLTVRPGATYLVANAAAENPADFPLASFTVAGAQGAAIPPAPDAIVRMRDYDFDAVGRLPRDGVVRFENRGSQIHIAVAFPIKQGVPTRRMLRALRRGRGIGRLTGGPVTEPVSLLSSGAQTDVEVSFPRRGRYALVCFYGDEGSRNRPHNALGMVEAVRVGG